MANLVDAGQQCIPVLIFCTIVYLIVCDFLASFLVIVCVSDAVEY